MVFLLRKKLSKIIRFAMSVMYSDRVTKVMFGDKVVTRLWYCFFRKTNGRVVYIPGVSQMNSEFEHSGLRWVGVRIGDGSVYGAVIDPSNGCLQKSIQFVGRDSSPVKLVSPLDRSVDDEV